MPVIVAVGLVAMIGAIGALMLEADAGTEQLADEDSSAARATEEFKQKFGDDPVLVLVKGDLEQLVLTSDLSTLLSLEGCLSGNAPDGQVFTDKPAPAACAELAKTKPARVVYGPATFLNQFAIQAGKLLEQQSEAAVTQSRIAAAEAARRARQAGLDEAGQLAAGRAAAQEVLTAFQQQLLQLATKYGQTGLPRIDDPTFVSSVVFDASSDREPKSKFAYLFPSSEAALISVRLEPDLSEAEQRDAVALINDAVADPAFKIRNTGYVVSGFPVVIEETADTLSSETFVLLAIALVVMAVALAIFVGPPLRLLPLAIALGAAVLTFGGLAALGGSLTLAALAVLPVLIGLAVDYAIQFQARFGELSAAGRSPAAAAVEAAAVSGPVIATAALATGAGFLVLLFWPIPVIRSFGLLLLAGIGFAYALSLTVGLAALSLSAAGRPRRGRLSRFAAGERFTAIAAARRRAGGRLRELGKRAVGVSITHSSRLLVAAFAIALIGWVGGTQTDINADFRKLLPSDLAALEEVEQLEQVTGASGDLYVSVQADDLSDPAVVNWMGDYKRRVLAQAGYEDASTACLDESARLCPLISLSDLFGEEGVSSAAQVSDLLALLPPYFSQAVISAGAEEGAIGDTASIGFGIKAMPFDEQKQLVDAIRAEIDPPGIESDPPPGVTAEVVGLPVLIADASSSLTRDRYLLTLGGLLAVGLALLAVLRSVRRALIPLIPIFLATGWSAGAIWLLGVDLNPMSATLGALVIAIATEFSVLLAARYEEERERGAALSEALRRAYATTGAAVLASGITATAGFAVLIASDIPLLRDFGIATVLDLGVALASVLIFLPAALVFAEGRLSATRLARPSDSAPLGSAS